MAKNQKAHDLAREMADRLRQRQSLAVVESLSAESGSVGAPLLRVGSAAAGSPGALIRIQPVSWSLAVDVLGLASTIHVPLVIKIGFEANTAAGAGADINTLAHITQILGEVLSRGCMVQVYLSSNGDNPDDADLDNASILQTTWNPDPVYGMIAGQ